MIRGTCVLWDSDEGSGALRAPGLERDVWCLWTHLDFAGERDLHVGEVVEFDWEVAEQDGYRLRATRVRRPGVPARPPDPSTDRFTAVEIELDLAVPAVGEPPFVTESRRARTMMRDALQDLWSRREPLAVLSMWEPTDPSHPTAAVSIGSEDPFARVQADADGAAVVVEDAPEALPGTTPQERVAAAVTAIERLLRDRGRLP